MRVRLASATPINFRIISEFSRHEYPGNSAIEGKRQERIKKEMDNNYDRITKEFLGSFRIYAPLAQLDRAIVL